MVVVTIYQGALAERT